MPTTEHEGLEREFEYVTNEFESKHIKSLYEGQDPLMHESPTPSSRATTGRSVGSSRRA